MPRQYSPESSRIYVYPQVTEKVCTKCKLMLPIETFDWYCNNNKRYYKSSQCRPCKYEGHRQWYFQKGHKKVKDYLLFKLYGITRQRYNAMLKAQNGVCKICRSPERTRDKRTGKPLPLAVDHCHRSKTPSGAVVIRGFLCSTCNNGLGCFRDSESLLHAAYLYLQSNGYEG